VPGTTPVFMSISISVSLLIGECSDRNAGLSATVRIENQLGLSILISKKSSGLLYGVWHPTVF